MPETTHQLIHKILRVPKDEAAFTYFQLESNEGLCFYSTLDQSLKEPYRDIEAFGDLALEREINHFFEYLRSSVNYEIILDEIIEDSAQAVNQFEKKGKKHVRRNEGAQ